MSLNNLSDYQVFGLEEFDSNSIDLQRLNDCMEKYFETILNIQVEKNYVDIQAIINNNDIINMLRLVTLFNM